MPEEKIQVIVPDSLKEPLKFDLWRLRTDADKNLILDFAKKDIDNQMVLVSSVSIENSRLDGFIIEFFSSLIKANKDYNLNISVFKEAENPAQKKEE